ncbi:hypothetical protein Anapl_00893 [Anas platyrhynchos]|uniref:Uncharacterized protein n=1 Tax=Anas platyrhynchos TaxID=8839 RepID=R0LQZ5_ANAPL|nr:hypothetical protein Anapl_00893 [Anas platyrhynchos]
MQFRFGAQTSPVRDAFSGEARAFHPCKLRKFSFTAQNISLKNYVKVLGKVSFLKSTGGARNHQKHHTKHSTLLVEVFTLCSACSMALVADLGPVWDTQGPIIQYCQQDVSILQVLPRVCQCGIFRENAWFVFLGYQGSSLHPSAMLGKQEAEKQEEEDLARQPKAFKLFRTSTSTSKGCLPGTGPVPVSPVLTGRPAKRLQRPGLLYCCQNKGGEVLVVLSSGSLQREEWSSLQMLPEHLEQQWGSGGQNKEFLGPGQVPRTTSSCLRALWDALDLLTPSLPQSHQTAASTNLEGTELGKERLHQGVFTTGLCAAASPYALLSSSYPRENQNKTKSGEKNKDKGKDKRRIDKGKGDVVQSSTGKATDPARSPPLFRDNEIEGQGSPSQQSDNRMSQCQMCHTVYILAQAQTPEEPEEATDTMKQPPAHLEAPGPMAVQEVTSHRRSRPPATTKSLLRCYSDEHVMTGLEEKDEKCNSSAEAQGGSCCSADLPSINHMNIKDIAVSRKGPVP